LVLIHGVGGRLEAWDDVVAALDRQQMIVRYDLRGHGRSERAPGPYSLELFAADHVALLAKLDIDSADIAGCSLGGLIAQQIALSYPEAVRRLIILSAVAGRTRQERDRVAERLSVAEKFGPAEVAQRSGDRWFTPEFRARYPDRVARHLETFAANDPAAYVAAYRVLATSDLHTELHRIHRPTLAMTGANDIGSPPHMTELMAERIPSARAVIIPNQRHELLVEVPERVAREIMDFLDQRNLPNDPKEES
jgi:3-oxoadipate enol-lactonase